MAIDQCVVFAGPVRTGSIRILSGTEALCKAYGSEIVFCYITYNRAVLEGVFSPNKSFARGFECVAFAFTVCEKNPADFSLRKMGWLIDAKLANVGIFALLLTR